MGTARPDNALDDGDYPAYSMGAASEMLGVTPAFLRALGRERLITPRRSDGGHRRYSRHELERAGRARNLVDEGMSLAAACRVVTLEDKVSGLEDQVSGLEGQVSGLQDRLATAHRRINELDPGSPPEDLEPGSPPEDLDSGSAVSDLDRGSPSGDRPEDG